MRRRVRGAPTAPPHRPRMHPRSFDIHALHVFRLQPLPEFPVRCDQPVLRAACARSPSRPAPRSPSAPCRSKPHKRSPPAASPPSATHRDNHRLRLPPRDRIIRNRVRPPHRRPSARIVAEAVQHIERRINLRRRRIVPRRCGNEEIAMVAHPLGAVEVTMHRPPRPSFPSKQSGRSIPQSGVALAYTAYSITRAAAQPSGSVSPPGAQEYSTPKRPLRTNGAGSRRIDFSTIDR